MFRSYPFRLLGIILATSVILAGCSSKSPEQKVLDARSLWKVEIVDSIEHEDGSLSAQFRLSGPVKNELETLTVRIEMLGVDDRVLQTLWHPFDVAGVERGITVERVVRLPATSEPIGNLAVDPVRSPTPDQIPNIPELANLSGT